MQRYQKIVVKVGTSTLTEGTSLLSRRQILVIVQQIAQLHDEGRQVILVTSGSIAAGREIVNKVDGTVPGKQMLSAVGQVRLMQIWAELFGLFTIPVGQLLLTRGDFSSREGYLNVRNTLLSLLQHNVIPIINENDSVATKEIEFGDNDNLSALAANMIAADLLILLTDREGLYRADPQIDPHAALISLVEHIDDSVFRLAGKTTKKMGMGAGGMATKVEAAQLATTSGTPTVIASAAAPSIIIDLANGKKKGTLFLAKSTPLESRKRWLLSETVRGQIIIDQGAVDSLLTKGASLLPVGITETKMTFKRGDIVQMLTPQHTPLAVGITNYSQQDIQQVQGANSQDIESILGYSYGPEVIHRDHMALLPYKERG
ncbi:MAG: glutamate 5-kinase [Waddliaceae bacterium]